MEDTLKTEVIDADIMSAIEELIADSEAQVSTAGSYQRVLACTRQYGEACAKAQREKDALYLEGRATEIEAGQGDASPSAWMARIFRDEAKKIREG